MNKHTSKTGKEYNDIELARAGDAILRHERRHGVKESFLDFDII